CRFTAAANHLAPRAGTYAMLAVSDTGIGMDDATRQRIFEPFFTTKEIGKGSGLGLSQVYGMARQSGGTATIESTPGHGTTVRLYIPRAAAKNADGPAAPEPVQHGKSLDGATVLVVDDDFQVRNFVADSLVESGYRTLEAADGQSALRILEDEAVDLAVIDLAMPGMDGRALAKSARQRRKDLPILFITAYVEPDSSDAEQDGPLLMKPFRAAALAREIGGILARARLIPGRSATR
ncbi:MAG TPA: response regulator, partial [Stellaceae bacterium]